MLYIIDFFHSDLCYCGHYQQSIKLSIVMTFYSRKSQKTNLSLRDTATSLTLIKQRPQTSNASFKPIHIRLLSASKNLKTEPTHTKFPEQQRPLSKLEKHFRQGAHPQLRKRCRRKVQQMYRLIGSLDVTTSSWCLYDSSCKKYVGFRQGCKREVASLTKIMTVLVAIETLEMMGTASSFIKITKDAADMIGTSASLRSGNWICLGDLLYGTMLPSGNDAAYSLAEYIGYLLTQQPKFALKNQTARPRIDLTQQPTTIYVNQFLRAMNDKAKKLDLSSTWFSNPHGLANAFNTSSARDMVILSRFATKKSIFRNLMNAKEYRYKVYQDDEGQKIRDGVWRNTNRLLHKGWEGVKTGITQAAGSCLASLRQGIYIVVLNSQTESARFSDTEKIFNWYQSNKDKKQTKSAALFKEESQPSSCKAQVKTEGSI